MWSQISPYASPRLNSGSCFQAILDSNCREYPRAFFGFWVRGGFMACSWQVIIITEGTKQNSWILFVIIYINFFFCFKSFRISSCSEKRSDRIEVADTFAMLITKLLALWTEVLTLSWRDHQKFITLKIVLFSFRILTVLMGKSISISRLKMWTSLLLNWLLLQRIVCIESCKTFNPIVELILLAHALSKLLTVKSFNLKL